MQGKELAQLDQDGANELGFHTSHNTSIVFVHLVHRFSQVIRFKVLVSGRRPGRGVPHDFSQHTVTYSLCRCLGRLCVPDTVRDDVLSPVIGGNAETFTQPHHA
jgi:hypothetical protein